MTLDIVDSTLYVYTEETKHISFSDLREFARMCRDFGDKAFDNEWAYLHLYDIVKTISSLPKIYAPLEVKEKLTN